MRSSIRAALVVAVSVAACLGSALATTNQSVPVTGSVVGDCATVPATGTLGFGSYNPFSNSDLAQSYSFSIHCTRGDANFTVAVNGGLNFANATSGSRAMKNGTTYLSYQLYQDSAHTATWPFSTSNGAGTAVSETALGVNSVNTIGLFGVVPHGQTSSAVGSFTDTVTITVNY